MPPRKARLHHCAPLVAPGHRAVGCKKTGGFFSLGHAKPRDLCFALTLPCPWFLHVPPRQLEYLVSRQASQNSSEGFRLGYAWMPGVRTGYAFLVLRLLALLVALPSCLCQVLAPDRQRFVEEQALPEYRRLLLHVLVAAGGKDAFIVTPPQPQLLAFPA